MVSNYFWCYLRPRMNDQNIEHPDASIEIRNKINQLNSISIGRWLAHFVVENESNLRSKTHIQRKTVMNCVYFGFNWIYSICFFTIIVDRQRRRPILGVECFPSFCANFIFRIIDYYYIFSFTANRLYCLFHMRARVWIVDVNASRYLLISACTIAKNPILRTFTLTLLRMWWTVISRIRTLYERQTIIMRCIQR